jgi:hypothetical protein
MRTCAKTVEDEGSLWKGMEKAGGNSRQERVPVSRVLCEQWASRANGYEREVDDMYSVALHYTQ